MFERDEHFVIDLRHKKRAASVTCHHRGNANPISFVGFREPPEVDFDPASLLRIVNIGHQPGNHSINKTHVASIRAVKSVV